MAEPLRRVLALSPFQHQIPLLEEQLPAKQAFLPWGTKAGKTTSMVMRMARVLWDTREKKYRWIAPIYGLSDIGEKRMLKALPEGYYKHWKADRVIEGPQGSTLQFLSGEKPDHLPGEDIHGAVIDEAPRCKEDVYDQVLSTTLAADGWLCAIGTPKGRNWFYRHVRLAQKGIELGDGAYLNTQALHYYKHFPSYVNPGVLKSNLDNFREVTTEMAYRQLVLAQFVDDSAGVFPSLTPCTYRWEHVPEPDPNDIYVLGVDIGAKNDYTVITVWSVNLLRLVYWERFTWVDTVVIENRTAETSSKWNNAIAYVDRGGIGLSITNNLYRRDVPIGLGTDGEPGVHFTARNKPAMVHNWNLALERREPQLPPFEVWPEFHNEHNDYEYTITKAGNWTFGAPEGMHDDTVASSLLGWYGLTRNRFSGQVLVI